MYLEEEDRETFQLTPLTFSIRRLSHRSCSRRLHELNPIKSTFHVLQRQAQTIDCSGSLRATTLKTQEEALAWVQDQYT